MTEIVDAAAAIQDLGVTGILGGLVLIMGLIVKRQWDKIDQLQRDLLRMARGKDLRDDE
jgi:hypothetical protein